MYPPSSEKVEEMSRGDLMEGGREGETLGEKIGKALEGKELGSVGIPEITEVSSVVGKNVGPNVG